MQRTDRRYKILFDSHGIVEALVGFACTRLGLGEPDLQSVAALPTVRDVNVWGHLLETVQDQCWRFRTRREDGVLLACEIQSGREYLMLVRLLAYACVTLVSLDRREHFSSRRPPPLPCLFLVYTGPTPWTPPSLSALTRGYVSAPGPLFPYIYMDVLHDDFSDWGLPRELDLMVRAERARFPADYLASGFPEGVRGLTDPHTVRALVEFMKLTMRGWSEQSVRDREIFNALQLDWDAITTPEGLTMAAERYQRGYAAVKEESWQAGLQEGLQEGRQAGLQEGARNKEVDMLCELLLPVVGREFVDELRTLLGNDGLLARLDPNTVFDLRLRYGTNPAELRQAVRDRLGQA